MGLHNGNEWAALGTINLRRVFNKTQPAQPAPGRLRTGINAVAQFAKTLRPAVGDMPGNPHEAAPARRCNKFIGAQQPDRCACSGQTRVTKQHGGTVLPAAHTAQGAGRRSKRQRLQRGVSVGRLHFTCVIMAQAGGNVQDVRRARGAERPHQFRLRLTCMPRHCADWNQHCQGNVLTRLTSTSRASPNTGKRREPEW